LEAQVPERFLIRAEGGPRPGSKITSVCGWPLPALLLAEGGQYVMISEIQPSPQQDQSEALRGAEYRWQPGDPTAEQLTAAIAVAIRACRFEEVMALMHRLALRDPESAGIIYGTVTLLGTQARREGNRQ
jgi:hypothetical protein